MKKYFIGTIILVIILVVFCPIIDTFAAAEVDSFVSTNGVQFVLNGKPFYFA